MNETEFCHRRRSPALRSELSIITTDFPAFLRGLGNAELTIGWYRNRLIRAATWLTKHGSSLSSLAERDLIRVARRLSRSSPFHGFKMYRAALRAWLRFLGHDIRRTGPRPDGLWRSWLDDYDRFLASDQGLSANTRIYRRRYARCFMGALFGAGTPRWKQIRPQDIWRFSERFSRGLKPCSANVMLFSLKNFLRFVHLRGGCTRNLIAAVPHFSNYGYAPRTQVLSEEQRSRLLAAFPNRDACGLRDRAIGLCLLELGLRAQEVADLKVDDIDWKQSSLRVPAVKTGRPRELPLPNHVLAVLHAYMTRGRDGSSNVRLFLRHRSFVGQPFSLGGIRQMMKRAYRRCGFPTGWTGTHRLRHSFATRLYNRGADPKQIADILGHRDLASTNTYLQSDLASLRALVRPWPL